MNVCKKCGCKDITIDSKYCPECGNKIKNQSNIGMIFLGLFVISLILGSFIGARAVLFKTVPTGPRSVYYDSKGIYQYLIDSKKTDRITELNDDTYYESADTYELDENLADLVSFTSDYRYAVYMKEMQYQDDTYMNIGNLYYTNLEDDEKHRKDNLISSKVQSYIICNDGTIVYRTDGDVIYSVKLQKGMDKLEKTKLGTGVFDILINEDKTSVFWYTDQNTAYVYNPSSGENKKKLSDSFNYFQYADKTLNTIYFMNQDYDLMVLKDLNKISIIDTDVETVYPMEKTNHVYYTKKVFTPKIENFITDMTGIADIETDIATDIETDIATDIETDIATDTETNIATDTETDDEHSGVYDSYYYGDSDNQTSYDGMNPEYDPYYYGNSDYDYSYGDDYDYADGSYDTESWESILNQEIYISFSNLYFYDGNQHKLVAENINFINNNDLDLDKDRIVFVKSDINILEPIIVTQAYDNAYELSSQIENEIINSWSMSIAMEDKTVDTGFTYEDINNQNAGFLDANKDIYYYMASNLSGINTDIYSTFDAIDKESWSLYSIEFDKDGVKSPTKILDDVDYIGKIWNGRVFNEKYDDYYDVAPDLFIDNEEIAKNVGYYYWDEENYDSPIYVLNNIYMENDYYTGILTYSIGDFSEYHNGKLSNILYEVSAVRGYKDGHFEFLCNYDFDQETGEYYYRTAEGELIKVADDVSGIRASDIY